MNDFKEIIEECIAQKDFYNADRIKQVYLEYRRSNNIFEVGDLVVYESGYNKIMEVLRHPRSKRITVRKHKGWGFGQLPISNIRHATDAEIAAGHRL